MTTPFSACMQIKPPDSAAAVIAWKIVPSSTRNIPGYAMNNLKLDTPCWTRFLISGKR